MHRRPDTFCDVYLGPWIQFDPKTYVRAWFPKRLFFPEIRWYKLVYGPKNKSRGKKYRGNVFFLFLTEKYQPDRFDVQSVNYKNIFIVY